MKAEVSYYLGIDGGGTKTLFHLANQQGSVLRKHRTNGISYRQYSMETVLDRITQGTAKCLAPEGLTIKDLSAVCIGYPCYGESGAQDRLFLESITKLLDPVKVIVVNDVEIAWAGALAGAPGIHVVCGTGAIAYGKNAAGDSARCGGWLDYFSDEGSGYWLGRKAMQLFSMQADGRVPKGALYGLLCDRLELKSDFDFIDLMVRDYIPYRDKVASMQMYLLQAAQAGDASAVQIYARAVQELARLVKTLMERLQLSEGCPVTYSGSLFQAEELMLKPFAEAVAAFGGRLAAPRKEPVDGAVCLAIKEDRIHVCK